MTINWWMLAVVGMKMIIVLGHFFVGFRKEENLYPSIDKMKVMMWLLVMDLLMIIADAHGS